MTDVEGSARVDAKVLDELERRVLWLAGSGRGEQGAGSARPTGEPVAAASMVSIVTALCFGHLSAGDRVSLPASGASLARAVRRLATAGRPAPRVEGGGPRYPSFCDVRVGSTGSRVLAPLYAAAVRRYVDRRFGPRTTARFVSVVEEDELGAGAIWECLDQPPMKGLGNVLVVVDLSRQQTAGVVPDDRARRLRRFFSDAGWHVLEARYGHLLSAAFARPNGAALRHHMESFSNEDYQQLFEVSGTELRRRFLYGADPSVVEMLEPYDGRALADLVFNVGGHDIDALLDCFEACDSESSRPSVVFAHTVGGWSSPRAGLVDPLRPEPDTDAARLLRVVARRSDRSPAARSRLAVPTATGAAPDRSGSGPSAFAESVSGLAGSPTVGARLVTVAGRHARSMSGLVEQIGRPDHHLWAGPGAGVIDLVSELGLAHEHHGQALAPIAIGADAIGASDAEALALALRSRARFVYAGLTQSAVDLADPEHRVAAAERSMAHHVPGAWTSYPVFGIEVDWVICEAVRLALEPEPGGAPSYVQLSHRSVDPAPLIRLIDQVGREEVRRRVLSGAIRLADPTRRSGPRITIACCGPTVTDALAAAADLEAEGVAATVVHVTTPGTLRSRWLELTRAAVAAGRPPARPSGLAEAFAGDHRRHPLVTVAPLGGPDLDWMGAALGCPRTLDTGTASGAGGTTSGEWGPSPDHVVNAALIALEPTGP